MIYFSTSWIMIHFKIQFSESISFLNTDIFEGKTPQHPPKIFNVLILKNWSASSPNNWSSVFLRVAFAPLEGAWSCFLYSQSLGYAINGLLVTLLKLSVTFNVYSISEQLTPYPSGGWSISFSNFYTHYYTESPLINFKVLITAKHANSTF